MSDGGAPLAGVSVVVTRPDDADDPLAAALAAAGARVVPCPMVEIVDPEDDGAALAAAARSLERYDWVAFTSANAVRRLAAALAAVGPGAQAALARLRLAAVGAATADALGAMDLVPRLVADPPSAARLGEQFPEAPRPGAAVLFPASASAMRTLPDALRAKGWAVDEVTAYRTVPAPPPPGALVAELAAASAVTFASPSAVRAYVSARADDGRALPVPPVVACIGPVTAEAARAVGLAPAIVARRASGPELAGALARALGGTGGGARGGADGGTRGGTRSGTRGVTGRPTRGDAR